MALDLSIIIPAYNEEKFIGRTLATINKLVGDIAYEIIVVDNGSSDATPHIAAEYPCVQVLSIPKSTISRARNAGAKIANSSFLAFIDADILITERWVTAIKRKLLKHTAAGNYLGGFPVGIPNDASMLEKAWFGAFTGTFNYVRSANLVVSTKTFNAIGGFDETLITAEDVDFSRRAKRQGVHIDADPELFVIHLGFPHTIKHFFKREMWHGIGNFRDFPTFLQSRVSIAAIVWGMLLLIGICFNAFEFWFLGNMCILAHVLFPLLYVLRKFRLQNKRYLVFQYFLGYLYFTARVFSGIRAITKLHTAGHRASPQ